MTEAARIAAIAGGRKIDRLRLLEEVDKRGSISAAAKALRVSYKAAWESLDALNTPSERPLVARSTGGSAGGGTRLTPHGRQVLALLRDVDGDVRSAIDAMSGRGKQFERFFRARQLMRNWNMKTS